MSSTYQEEKPLPPVEQRESLDGVGGLIHRRHQGRDTGDQVSSDATDGETRLLFIVVYLDRARLSILELCHRGHDPAVIRIGIAMGIDKGIGMGKLLDDDGNTGEMAQITSQ